jgi:hypothetical protein
MSDQPFYAPTRKIARPIARGLVSSSRVSHSRNRRLHSKLFKRTRMLHAFGIVKSISKYQTA